MKVIWNPQSNKHAYKLDKTVTNSFVSLVLKQQQQQQQQQQQHVIWCRDKVMYF